jgi:large subunit ribosomal protein L44e
MKSPKERNCYCPKCNKHTIHKVSIYKKGKERQKTSAGWRRIIRKRSGYGSKPKPTLNKLAKINKKVQPNFKCVECGNTVIGIAQRLKKFEIMNK